MHALTGTDYEWYCSDSIGNVARMTTAGQAPVPISVLNNLELNDKMKMYGGGLAERGDYLIYTRDIYVRPDTGKGLDRFIGIGDVPVPDNEFNRTWLKDFIRSARQGFFVYDWQDTQRPKYLESNTYELVTAPTVPFTVGDFPPEFRSLLQGRTLQNILFSEALKIDIASLLQCEK
jgi:hypothetical protein